MPRGRPKKEPEVKKPEVTKAEPKQAKPKGSLRDQIISEEKEKPQVEGTLSALQLRIVESRKVLDHPLPPGQKLFEAPDGMIIIGEADKDTAWYAEGDDGNGIRINPLR